MITRLETIDITLDSSDSETWEFQINNSFDTNQYNSIALNYILFPNNIYNNSSSFSVDLDAETIEFPPCNMSFNWLVSKLTQGNITCRQYLENENLQTGKLELYNANNTMFALDIPADKEILFGYPEWDAVSGSYISEEVCLLSENNIVQIQSNAIKQNIIENNVFNILQVISLNNLLFGEYFQSKYNILSNRKEYTRCKSFKFQFVDQEGASLVFENRAKIYLRISLFEYEYDFVNTFYNIMNKQLDLYQLKNFPDETHDRYFEEENNKNE